MTERTLIAALLLGLLLSRAALAQDSANADLSWQVIGSGGGRSSSDDFVLTGTIGQAATSQLTGGRFVLHGGFWPAVAGSAAGPTPSPTQPVTPAPLRIYLPIVLKAVP